MKIVIEIEGFRCEASTDYLPQVGMPRQEIEAVNASIYKSLLNEVHAVTFKLIEAKYGPRVVTKVTK